MQQITPEGLQKLRLALPTMPEKEKRRIADLLKQYQNQLTQRLGKDSFLDFITHVYPGYKVGPHHRKLARIFEEIAEGKKKRVIVNIAPRHGKSEMISYLAPAWFWAQILMASISLLAWAALLLAVVPISLLLMILTLNRRLSRVVRTYSSQHGSGFNQAQSSD